MRLTNREIEIIKEVINKYFKEKIELYLFGSRLNKTKKGGDIDLYILTNHRENLTYKRLISKVKLEERLYKPIDIIISNKKKSLIDIEALKGIKII
jgi:predicted nucleotidyltransferase